jgi:CarD family transcriptional regulator
MIFKAGDAIVHPVRGAGVVERIEERQWRGSNDLYYRIKLVNQPRISLMVPISATEKLGLRHVISPSKLYEVWRVLGADPTTLPGDHKERHKLVEEKLHTGDVFQVAEVVRDMAWRQERKGRLTMVGKRRYEEGMQMLAGEIAAAQDVELINAQAQIHAKLAESLSSTTIN